jgi:autotransporter-associated beta strand protein
VLLGGTGSLVNNGTLIFNRSDASTYSGIISGTGSLTKQGGGTLTLLGNNSSTGDTTITAGVLQVGAGGTTGFIAGNLVNNAAVMINRSDAITYAGTISGTGTLTKSGAGALTLTGIGTSSGVTNLNAGVLAVGGTSALGSGTLALNGGTLRAASGGGSFAAAVSLNTNTTIAGSDALTISGPVTLNGFNTLTFTNTAQTTIGGRIGQSSTSILIKQGSGELQLTGANTYTGGTLVQSGTVRINNSTGSAFGTGAVTVESGATLTGAGMISGAVQMNGTWAPGNSPGLVTVNSNVVLGGNLDMELGGLQRATSATSGSGYYDAMNVSSGLALGGTLNVALTNGFTPSYGDSFALLQAAALSGDFGTVNYPALSGGLSWLRTTSATAMTITVVPEPSTLAISAIATAGLAGLMRWRKRRSSEIAI